ncbi:MAG: type II secretion system protein GspD [Candidatus Latescibacteria bacterium]|nr:type II secretion system protein GspD [Candidatus Latescibacterota bacterium]
MRRTLPWLLGLCCWIAAVYAQEPMGVVASPFRSLNKTRALLDAADLRVLLPLGYAAQAETQSYLAGRPGVQELRVYARPQGILEIAIAAGVAGGYDFVLYGRRDPAGLEEVWARFVPLIQSSRGSGPEPVEVGHQMYNLGHIEADRALALLKALGYSSIEFEAKAAAPESYEEIFGLVAGKETKLPLVVKVANASKTSLLAADGRGKAAMPASGGGKGIEGAPQLGGSHLHGTTSDEPQERLLVVYDRNDPEALERLVNLLQSQIDVAAQQIVIEALVIEVNTNQLRDLGVGLNTSQKNIKTTFETSDKGLDLPFTFLFSRDTFSDFLSFKGRLEALAETGNAKILSSPSVLVLNDRQARIQVGQQIPVVRSTTTVSTTTSSVEYFPIGIVLNLRPRINPEGSEVTMQIETIISSISQSNAQSGSSSQVAFAPVVDNRQVETFVRVADGTPFIIGGLFSTDQQGRKVGLPLISDIPILGALFSRQHFEQGRREVIVVITPHIVPLEDNSFSYLIPKDSKLFDRFDTQLFRNAYRVRDDEIWDLKFIQESPALQELTRRVRQACQEDLMLRQDERISPLLEGRIPGEDVLVRRMLGDIVGKLEFDEEVDLNKVFFFVPAGDASQQDTQEDRTLAEVLEPIFKTPDRALLLSFEAQTAPRPGRPFTYPVAALRDTLLSAGEQERTTLLRNLNPVDGEGRPRQWTILLANQDDVRHLRQVLVLKRLLELNGKLPLSLQAFHPGLQILFPSREDMRARYHLVDREVAQLFYETAPNQYYPAFERNFNLSLREVDKVLGRRGN